MRRVVRRPRGAGVEANGESHRFKDTRWFRRNALPDPRLETPEDAMVERTVAEDGMPDTLPPPAAERAVPGGAAPAEETVEEYFEE
jgi:hypothetical protein